MRFFNIADLSTIRGRVRSRLLRIFSERTSVHYNPGHNITPSPFPPLSNVVVYGFYSRSTLMLGGRGEGGLSITVLKNRTLVLVRIVV